VTLRGHVTHKIDADDTSAYADRSNQEKQYTNIQGSIAIIPKERRDEKQNRANTDNHVIKDVPVHGAEHLRRWSSAIAPEARLRLKIH
jgi:hypothetical protein